MANGSESVGSGYRRDHQMNKFEVVFKRHLTAVKCRCTQRRDWHSYRFW